MRCTTVSKANFLLPVMALLACGAAMAQSPTYKLGRPPTEEELRIGNNIVGAEGKELPPGSGTVQEGATIFAAKCAMCHGKDAQGGVEYGPGMRYPSFIGGRGTLTTPTPKTTVESYMPYATTLWDAINRTMPPWPLEKNPAASGKRALSQNPNEVYALTAFILYKCGIIKETDVMNKNTLVEVQMPNRHGFYPDPPQETPDKDHGWLPYWDKAPGAKPAAK
jgi:mono/diheme cytochrome c family protein